VKKEDCEDKIINIKKLLEKVSDEHSVTF